MNGSSWNIIILASCSEELHSVRFIRGIRTDFRRSGLLDFDDMLVILL